MIKNFAIFKVENKKTDVAPDYTISAKINEKFIDVGGCWVKESKGKKYMSCKLSNRYVDQSDYKKSRDGFHIAIDPKIEEGEASLGEIDTKTSNGKDLKDIPF